MARLYALIVALVGTLIGLSFFVIQLVELAGRAGYAL
jgi:hypothetical protein